MTDTSESRFDVSTLDASGKLLLRVTLAGLMLFHGVHKLIHGVGGVESMLTAIGLPGWFAYGVYVGEVVAPLLMIIGFLTRISAIVFAFNMLVAIAVGHAGEIFQLGEFGEWAIELPVLYLMGAVCVALLGPGRYAVGRTEGWLA